MKATQRDFGSLAGRAARQCGVFLFCGPDEAGASAAAAKIVSLLENAGDRVDIAGAALRKDASLLGDEARSGSLFGNDRHIQVRAVGDEVAAALENHLQAAGDACPVLIIASSMTDKSRTAKLLEKRDDALVAMFHPPDLAAVTASVRSMADVAGLQLNGDIAERIARAANLDVRLAQSEITKLALYCDADPQSPKGADAAMLGEIGAASEDDGFMPVVNTVLSGKIARLPGELRRMHEMSLNPVGLLLAFERRTAQLAQLAARIGPNGDIAGTIQAEKRARRIFWKDERDLAVQIARWRGKRLERLNTRLIDLHRALIANGPAGEVLLAHGLAQIARAAAPRR